MGTDKNAINLGIGNPMKITSKLQNVGLTIFSVMTGLANEHGAINLSQGFPDLDVHPDLIALVEKHMRAGHNQYAPMHGVAALRERIAEKCALLYGAKVDPEREVTVTTGATEALFAAITAVVRPGDEVIVFEPAFDSYVPAIELAGGVPVYVKLEHPDYAIDWERVANSVTPRTRLMILNSPHNPTGATLTAGDMERLSAIAEGGDFMILSDEVYEHIIFDGRAHASIARYPELFRRSFVVSSFGKTYHTTGWKVGYCLAPPPLTAELRKVHQYVNFATSTPVQHAYAEFMEDRAVYEELPAFYQEKRDLFLSLIRDSRFKPLPCGGTFFLMLDYADISDAPDTEFARELTTVHGVAAIPPSVFHHDGEDRRILRFCFAKRDDTLRQAAERLCAI